MSYKFRKFLFIFFVIIFFIMTSFFSLYAVGYRLSFSNILKGGALIQQTGILVLDSKPKGAEIFLWRQFRGLLFDDNVLRNKQLKTPYKIKNLLPGEYVLNLELEGYWNWQQKINIYPGQSSYVENVVLFKRSLPTRFIESSTQKIYLCPLDKKIFLDNDKRMIDLKTEQEVYLGKNISDVDFLGSGLVLLDNSLVFNYLRNDYIDLQKNNFSKESKVKIRSGTLFYLQDGLRSYNIKSEKEDILFLFDNIVDFEISNSFYFLVLKDYKNFSFQVYSQRQKSLTRSIDLPVSDGYEILLVDNSSGFVYIYDHEFKKMYVINLSFRFDNVWKVIDNVYGFNFVDGSNFVYHSSNEIYMFNSVLAEKFLISRFNDEIKSLAWHPKNYIIYSTDKDVFILDLRYNNQVINLVSLERVSNLALDRLGSILYFTGKIGNREGLYKLFIQ